MSEEMEDSIPIPELRKENKQLKLVLQKIQKHYKLREIEHKRLLMQCSVGLRAAAARLERQNQIILSLRREREESDKPNVMPDSTTENI